MQTIPVLDPPVQLRFHHLAGQGRPLLFVHGLGCAGSCDYPAVARAPALRDRRAILVDLLGSGFSDRPTDFTYTVRAHAEVLVEVLEQLAIDAFDLFGHSMGGAIALELATRVGPRVAHLVLSEPNLDPGGGTFSRALAARSEAHYLATGHRAAIEAAVRAGNAVWAGSLAATAPFAAHRAAVSLIEGGDPAWRTQLLQHPARRCVLFGATSLPDPDLEALPRHGVATAVVAGAGHNMAGENPAGLAEAIAAALED